MNTATTQVKLTLPLPLTELLQSKARQFGLPLSAFIRHILIKEADVQSYPVFQASKSTEKAALQAQQDYRAGRTISIKSKNDLDKFFSDL